MTDTDAVINALDSIATAIAQRPTDILSNGLFIALIGAFFGAFASYVFTVIHWSNTRKHDRKESLKHHFENSINVIQDIGVEYWLTAQTPTKHVELRAIELKLKSALIVGNRVLEELINSSKEKNENDKLRSVYSELFDDVTGGLFESKSRQPSNKTAIRITRQCADLSARAAAM